MEIIEVNNPKDWQLFHSLPHDIYRKDINWIAPLEQDVESILSPHKNQEFDRGIVKSFVLLENNRPKGRIAAFSDRYRQYDHNYKLGGIGFFECFEREKYANLLFKTAEDYLRSQDIQLVDGLINFGSRDTFWGLLVKGSAPPLYQENYHPPYYEKFLLNNGYQPYEQILTYAGNVIDLPFKRLKAISQRLQQRQPMYVKGFSFAEQEEFVKDFCHIYNGTFANSPITTEEVNTTLERGKSIIDPNLICLSYYEGKPAGFIVLYPDINPLLKSAKGKLNFWNIAKFFFKKQLTKTFCAKGISIGIHPDYQAQGIAALLIDYLCSQRNLKLYRRIYLTGVSTQNHQIRSIYHKLNLKVDRIHCTYRKALQENVPIKPLEFIDI